MDPLVGEQRNQEETEQVEFKCKKRMVYKQDNTFSMDGEHLISLRESLQEVAKENFQDIDRRHTELTTSITEWLKVICKLV